MLKAICTLSDSRCCRCDPDGRLSRTSPFVLVIAAEDFAAQHGIKAVRLRYWDWKLKRRGDEVTPPACVAEAKPAASFVEVSAAVPAERGQIEIITPRGYILHRADKPA